ncbi:hypothetical protein ACMFMG_004302 [Clarireedia jacksonii]
MLHAFGQPLKWMRGRQKPPQRIPQRSSRGCLGKSFAQTELIVFVAGLFKDFSAELVVGGDFNDEDSRNKKWYEERARVEREMSTNVEFYMSLRLTGKVPIRLVKRGKELFTNLAA